MRRRLIVLGLAPVLAASLLVAPARASLGPRHDIKAYWAPTDLPPGPNGEGLLYLRVRNVGDQSFSAPLTITDQLPEGVVASAIRMATIAVPGEFPAGTEPVNVDLSRFCKGTGSKTVSCEVPMTAAVESEGKAGSTVPPGELGTAPILTAVGLAPGGKEEVDFPWKTTFNDPEPSGWLPGVKIDLQVNRAPSTAANLARVEGGGDSEPATDADQLPFATTPALFGLVPGSYQADVFNGAYPLGKSSRQAGDHPFEQRVNFNLTTRLEPEDAVDGFTANGLLRTVTVTLPHGMLGNPGALPKCDPILFAQIGATANSTKCPPDTQVGYLSALLGSGEALERGALSRIALYNLNPPQGTPVDLGFVASGFVQGHIYATFDPERNYAIKAVVPDIGELVTVTGAEATLWGVPGDPAHDRFRFYPEVQENGDVLGAPFNSEAIRPFFTNPMDCGSANGGAAIRISSYEHPEEFTAPQEGSPLEVEGCEDPRFRFEPHVKLEPTDRHAGAPTGLEVHLEVPQQEGAVERSSEAMKLYAENGYPQGISTPPLKKAVVSFPEGMTLNPSAAQGLGSCSLEQIGIEPRGGRFVPNEKPVRCPPDSKYGTLTLHTPDLPVNEQPKGFIYIAKQGENPFGSLLALYLVIEEPERGILFKILGRVDLNQKTGQITTTFEDLPQFPVSDVEMSIKGGVRAGLIEPQTCGTKTIKAEFFSWQEPDIPHPVEDEYKITEKPDGSPCVNSLAERPFNPSFAAGTESSAAGSYSPFNLELTRADEDQELSRLTLTLPPGLAAKFTGVSICPEAGITQALSREGKEGDGALEQVDPSCPASSRIGTIEVGAGVGGTLSWVPGKVYLAGPYEGAPISIVVISPAVVGPFDLGVVTVRTALKVNPETAQGEATSDPFPQILQGIPVRIRDIRLDLNRPGFVLNPTSCEPMQIVTHVSGADGAATNPSARFQAADCASLGFHPSLSFRLKGGTHRAAHPRLKAVLRMPAGGANIARASVALPSSEFLDQGHLNNVCTRVQFKAHECPAASIYGWAKAKTPLFEHPLEGPVYLRSSSHLLPDLVAALKGSASQPVEVDLDGRIDSVNGGIRNIFEVVPDAPVSEFTLQMQGGRKGLLVNSTNLCAKTYRATTVFGAQNGRRATLHPVMRSSCPRRHGKGRHRHKGRGRGRARHRNR